VTLVVQDVFQTMSYFKPCRSVTLVLCGPPWTLGDRGEIQNSATHGTEEYEKKKGHVVGGHGTMWKRNGVSRYHMTDGTV
jgi:hypothetical protein